MTKEHLHPTIGGGQRTLMRETIKTKLSSISGVRTLFTEDIELIMAPCHRAHNPSGKLLIQ